MQLNNVTRLSLQDGIAVLSVDSPPVNAISLLVRQGLVAGIDMATADLSVRAIVLLCEGRTFFAGADITEFGRPRVRPFLQDVQALIEDSRVPVVAALHGTALGGGLEIALVAHYRVALPSARCGLPEIKLGLIAGAGGTQRLTRLLGPELALDMVTSGRMMDMPEALATGLVDALVEDGDLRGGAVEFARRLVAKERPLRKIRDMTGKIEQARDRPNLFRDFRKANAHRFKGFDAPESNIRAIEAAMTLPFAEGLVEERRLFDGLVGGSQSLAQRHVFFAERLAAQVPGIKPGMTTLPVRTVGVIGAGTMAGRIAMNFLNAGLPVTIVEAAQDALGDRLASIRADYESSVHKGKLAASEMEARMTLLTATPRIEDMADVDVVIEAGSERIEVKREIFQRLDAIARPDAVLATNTSCLDVDEIAGSTRRPGRVIGLHFLSPANTTRLLEVVRGAATEPVVTATAMKLAKTIGKLAVAVGNCTGFVGNRMLAVRQREAEALVLEGVMPWDVDRVLQDFGFPIGPFQMCDLAGNDVGWDSTKAGSSKLREIFCEHGRFGHKTRAGFYDYDEALRGIPSPVVEKIILDLAASRGFERRAVTDAEILQRCLYRMVNEGLKILEEGKASRASDIDIIWVTGYGWPSYRGGPMFWGETEGLDRILAGLRSLQASHGDMFRPATLLETLVAAGRRIDAT